MVRESGYQSKLEKLSTSFVRDHQEEKCLRFFDSLNRSIIVFIRRPDTSIRTKMFPLPKDSGMW